MGLFHFFIPFDKAKKNAALLFGIAMLLCSLRAYGQGGTWTWMRGGSLKSDGNNYGFEYGQGNYGQKGVAAATNEPPARYEACYWTDLDGNFWLFGGTWIPNGNRYGLGNDLWKFDVQTNLWTWMSGPNVIAGPDPAGVWGTKGIPSANNYPPARCYGANCWTDNKGDLWLYGGFGDKGAFNDLWRYHIASNEWTWMNGSPTPAWTGPTLGTMGIPSTANSPGDVIESKSAWVDAANNLWMFGGDSRFYNERNILWKYNPADDTWTWVNGSATAEADGIYGTFRVPDAANQPGSRKSYTRWKDGADNMYLFAGVGDTIISGYNDVWKYEPASNLWTWVSGSKVKNDAGAYPPAMCQFYSDNYFPPARFENPSPTYTYRNKCAKAFWTFGGTVPMKDERDSERVYNDLWLFNSENYSWAWMGGTKTVDHPGVYGSKGIPSSANVPAGRMGQAMWIDRYNNLWLFGGLSGTKNSSSAMNDLWRFVPDSNCFNTALLGDQLMPPVVTPCSRDTVIMKIGKHSSVHTSPGEGIAYNADSSVIYFFPSGTTSYTVTVSGTDCQALDSVKFTIPRSNIKAVFNISPKVAKSTAPVFQMINHSIGAQSYKWLMEASVVSTERNPSLRVNDTGQYCFTLVATDSLGCSDTASDCAQVEGVYPLIYVPSAFTPNGDNLNDVFRPIGRQVTIIRFSVYNRYGERVFVSANGDGAGWDGMYKGKPCDVGTYFYQVEYLPADSESSVLLKGDVALVR
jgi:gliding motility-associated-like protein